MIEKLKNYKSDKLDRLIYKHLGEQTRSKGYVLIINNKLVGYCLYRKSGKIIYLDWIWSKGHGTYFLKKLEKIWRKHEIILKVSIDPNERKSIVMRRLNFYIKNKFRVSDIKFRDEIGPLLTMFKRVS